MATTAATPPAQDAYDPYDAAMSAEWSPIYDVFGQVQAQVWPCVLEKGVGKVPFDPQVHDYDKRNTAIDLSILPVLPGRQPVERQMIVESREWASIVKPSLVALRTDLRSIHNAWVHAQLVPTGRTYESGGETKHATTIKFVRIFGSEDECLAAAEAGGPRGPRGANGAATPNAARTASPAPAASSAGSATAGGAGEARKTTAAKFLPAVVKAANGDLDRLGEMIAKNPILKEVYGDVSHPDVMAAFEGVPF